MFTCDGKEKEIVMQLNILDDDALWQHEVGVYPDSILFCSDGSVISGHGSRSADSGQEDSVGEISIIAWYPAFEVLEFFAGDHEHKIDLECYTAVKPPVERLNVSYIMSGPLS
tara:strand:+ start:67 stop:405 length:339 start_codon:yes stop_codon:yes gene_type:complete